MPTQYCSLCASDEGVLLDITEKNKDTICKQLEICALNEVKVEYDALKKICYKCVYELNQCYCFVTKYRQCKAKKTKKVSARSCCLCLESEDKVHIFDLEEQNNLINTPTYKIKDIINYDELNSEDRLICLSCVYTVDLLCDLRHVIQKTSIDLRKIKNDDLDYSTFPKIKTIVVSRKTTVRQSNTIIEDLVTSSDSESNTMAKRKPGLQKNRINNKLQSKSNYPECRKCETSIRSKRDIYKHHKTGYTLCKSCWSTVDPNSLSMEKEIGVGDTKLCSVLIKDILRDSSPKKNQPTQNSILDPNEIIVIEDSSESEISDPVALGDKDSNKTKEKQQIITRRKTTAKVPNDKTKQTNRQISKKPLKPQENGKVKNSTANVAPILRTGLRSRTTSKPNSESNVSVRAETTSRKRFSEKPTSVSDTEHSPKSLKKILQGVVTSKTDVSEESSNDDHRIARKRRKVSASKSKPIKKLVNKRKRSESAGIEKGAVKTSKTSEQPNEASDHAEENTEKPETAEDQTPEKEAKSESKSEDDHPEDTNRKRTRANSSASTETESIPVKTQPTESTETSTTKIDSTPVDEVIDEQKPESNDDANKSSKKSEPETTTNVEVSEEPAQKVRKRGRGRPRLESQPVENLRSSDSEVDTTPYVCTECGAIYESKLLGKTHSLTHFKQVEIKLHRVTVESVNRVEEGETTLKGADETDDQKDEQADNIKIIVDDDEEEDPADVTQSQEPPVAAVDVTEKDIASEENTEDKTVIETTNNNDTRAEETEKAEITETQENTPEESIKESRNPENSDSSPVEVIEDSPSKDNKDDSCNLSQNDDVPDNPVASTVKEVETIEVEEEKDQDEDAGVIEIAECTAALLVDEEETDKTRVSDKDGRKSVELDTEPIEIPDVNTEPIQIPDVEEDEATNADVQIVESEKNNVDEDDSVKCVSESPSPQNTDDQCVIVQSKETDESTTKVADEQRTKENVCESENNLSKTQANSIEETPEETNEVTCTDERSDSVDTAVKVLQEVFDLAAAEVQKRQDGSSPRTEEVSQEDSETVENISREIENTSDLPCKTSVDANEKKINDPL